MDASREEYLTQIRLIIQRALLALGEGWPHIRVAGIGAKRHPSAAEAIRWVLEHAGLTETEKRDIFGRLGQSEEGLRKLASAR